MYTSHKGVYACFSIRVDDNLEQNHCLFEEYRDPCRAGPRQEKPWVIGTNNFILLECSKYCIQTRKMMMTFYWACI